MIGVALSLVWLVFVAATPAMPVLGRQRGTQIFRSIDEYPDSETYPGLLVLRFDSGLFFASSDALHDRLRESLSELPEREAEIINRYFGLNADQSESLEQVGRRFNISRERVRQLKDRAISRIRKSMDLEEIAA